MARYTGPKTRLSRREGEDLFTRGGQQNSAHKSFLKRKFPPGMHGPRLGYPKPTQYGIQLREKQKVKRIYGILEKQFSKYYETAIKHQGDTGKNMLKLLEKRLDNVIYSLGWASSRPQARQIVTHKHVLINGKSVNIPSYQIKVGDVITIRTKSQKSPLYADLAKTLAKFDVPNWLTMDVKKLEGKVISEPVAEDLDKKLNMALIVEFYSR
jgi:small subunit ribosomal protein S4